MSHPQASTAARPRRGDDAIARAIFDGAVFGILEVGLDGRIRSANRACWDQLGYAPRELIGKPFTDLVHRDDIGAARAALKALSSGARADMRIERRYVRKDGSIGWVALTGERIEEPPAILVMAEEISARKRQEAVSAGERVILERIARGGALRDILEAIVLLVETHSHGMLGSILLVDDVGRVHVGAAGRLPAAYNEAIEGQPIGPAAGSCGTAAWRRETVITADIAHDPLWVDYRSAAAEAGLAASWSTPLFAPDGRVVGTLAQYYREPRDPSPRDLHLIDTARHLAEIAILRTQADEALTAAREELERRVRERTAELHTSEAQLRVLFEQTKREEEQLRRSERLMSEAQSLAHLGSWEWDVRADQVRWSDELYRIYGLEPQQFGATFEAFLAQVHPDHRERVAQAVMRAGRTGEPYTLEERIVRPSGEERWLVSSGRVERDGQGHATRLWGVCLDMTDQKRAEAAVRELNVDLERHVDERTVQLEAANRELEAFSYSVSHDLRAPLRAIDGFSQALLDDYDDRLDDTGRDWLRRVRAASQRMAQLIDDMLQLSRLTRGEMSWGPVDLSRLARESARDLLATAQGREIQLEIADGLQAWGDARLIRAALDNLLSNAFKFTSHHPRARIEVGEADGEFFVRDDGAGFDMAHADHLFKPFSRLHTTSEFEGSGIGLATVQRIVHRHGGRIRAEGAPERGATFTFTFGHHAGAP